ncbi:TIR domain-containing protein [Metabacillus endolithicus]|uniref:TIR domain-containing protein n=1 Tax=Metabacillus endolithicus TaxID=1535204 RepID=A0ABW5C085_9BACI|nr:TIR domain-containing protein [Metabacillus endolithicus]UPG61671.1 TIR domain-containing protein [Metabacillus endolithicus]
MGRNVFFSFHYKEDNWRAAQVRNMGVVEGNVPIRDNDWEEVKRKGDAEIKKWIDAQLREKSCTVVLVGENTSGRKWIKYEIQRSWELGKGVVGIRIHNLKNINGEQTSEGENPFDEFTLNGKPLSKVVKLYNPPYKISTNVYNNIKESIEDLVEQAIKTRKSY